MILSMKNPPLDELTSSLISWPSKQWNVTESLKIVSQDSVTGMNGSIQYHAVCPNCQPQHHIGNTYGYIETTNHMYMPQQEGYFRFSLESDKILMLNVFLINDVIFIKKTFNKKVISDSL